MSAGEGSKAATGRCRCTHCGTPFKAGTGSGEFCCTGCEYVYQLIQDQGFEQYYALRGKVAAPVQSAPFLDRDLEWVTGLQAKAEASGEAVVRAELGLQGISCLGCVWLIERLYQRFAGAVAIEINAQLGLMVLRWKAGAFDLHGFVRELQQFGYLAAPPRSGRRSGGSGLIWRIGLCGVFALNGMLFTLPRYLGMEADFAFARLFELLSLLFATLSMAVGGSYFIRRAWSALRIKVLHIDLPIALGVVLAYGGSLLGWAIGESSFVYLDFVCVFVFLMLVGRWAQEAAVERNRNAVVSEPDRVEFVMRKNPDGIAESVPTAELSPGDQLEIGSGRILPVNARLLSESAVVSLESINGESEPVTCIRGRLLPSGAINIGSTAVEVEALEAWGESLLSKLLGPGEVTAAGDATVERVLRIYLPAVLVFSLLGGLFWILSGAGPVKAFQVAISVLVVSCPCALGVAIPLGIEWITVLARRKRVYVKRPEAWASLASVRKIIFDKTGTLTLERPLLRNREAFDALDGYQRSVLLSLVEHSLHPVSRSLREELYARHPGTPLLEPVTGAVEELAGRGLRCVVDGVCWTLGRDFVSCAGADSGPVFARDDRILAVFETEDSVRPEAREEMDGLRADGYDLYLLSGDAHARVARVAEALQLPETNVMSRQSPVEKAEWVRRIDNMDTLMVGDGVNDSLAFDAAACRGTPLVDRSLLEQKADFFITGRAAGGVRAVLLLARRWRLTARMVFAFAVSYNVLAVAACLAGWMNPLVAAVIMPLSGLVSIGLVFLGLKQVLDG